MASKTTQDDHVQSAERWDEAAARAALKELARSAESVANFARRKGGSPQRLYYWKKRLERTEPSTRPAFVAVTMPTPPPGPIEGQEIEIRVGAVAVVVRQGCDVEHVARLVDALSRRTRAC